jgi:hypothetical protein
VLPETTFTVKALADPVGGPAVVGFKVTVTLPGGIDPLGKPVPVTEILVSPGSPELGEVGEVSVTIVVAPHSKVADSSNAKTSSRVFFIGLHFY